MPGSAPDEFHEPVAEPAMRRRMAGSLLVPAAGVVLAVVVGVAIRGWSPDLLFGVGVLVVAWVVSELVDRVLRRDEARR